MEEEKEATGEHGAERFSEVGQEGIWIILRKLIRAPGGDGHLGCRGGARLLLSDGNGNGDYS